jgi:hypothetical protein
MSVYFTMVDIFLIVEMIEPVARLEWSGYESTG